MEQRAGALSLTCVPVLDWPASGTIADIAGGTGTLVAAVLQAAPGARGILVDQPQVLERARRRCCVAVAAFEPRDCRHETLPPSSCSDATIRLRRLPLPTRCDRAGGPLVPALRPLLTRRRG